MELLNIIPLGITSYGWSAILIFALSLVLTYLIGQRRVQSGKAGLGCVVAGYTFLVVFIIMVFAVTITMGVGSSIYSTSKLIANGKRYQAEVVSYTSHESFDSDSRTTTTMYTPVVTFTTSSGKLVEHTFSYSSSSRPTVGDYIPVYYDEEINDAVSFGFGGIALFIGSLLMMVIMVFLFLGIVLYALNYDMSWYLGVVKYVGLNFFIPIIMILFDGLLVYGLFYGEEVPWFVSGILVFFILVLTMGIWGYIKMIRTSNIEWVRTGTGSWSGVAVPKEPEANENKDTWIKRND